MNISGGYHDYGKGSYIFLYCNEMLCWQCFDMTLVGGEGSNGRVGVLINELHLVSDNQRVNRDKRTMTATGEVSGKRR